MSDDVEMTAEWDGEALTPVARVCPDCAEEQIVIGNDTPAPREPAEAWALKRCCGTKDMRLWRWCWKLAEVTEPKIGRRTSFDRRRYPR